MSDAATAPTTPAQPPAPSPPPSINVAQAVGAILRGIQIARAGRLRPPDDSRVTAGGNPFGPVPTAGPGVPAGTPAALQPPNPGSIQQTPAGPAPYGGVYPWQKTDQQWDRSQGFSGPPPGFTYDPNGGLVRLPASANGDVTGYGGGYGSPASNAAQQAVNRNYGPATSLGIQLESSGNPGAVGDNGTAFGLLQNHTAIFKATAARMGIDTSQWQNAGQAPPAVQIAVGRQIPIGEYGPRTRDAIRARYPWATADMSMADIDQIASTNQQLAAAQPREPSEWGRPGAGFGSSIPGMMPTVRDTPSIIQENGLALLQIASAAMHAPTWMMVNAFGAYLRARNQRQVLDQKAQQNRWQTALKEATAQQTLESQMAGDAFAALGDNPDALTRALGSLATRFGDQTLAAALQNGGVDAAHRLLQERDQRNVPLQKLQYQIERQQAETAKAKATTDQQAAIDHAVAADDVAWEKAHPDASDGDKAQAHLDHLAGRTQEMKARPTAARPTTPAQQAALDQQKAVNNAVSADDADWAKQNPDATEGQKAQAHLDHLAKRTQELKARPGADSLEASKTMQVVNPDGSVERTIMARERRDQAGWIDSGTGQPVKLKPGQTLRQVTPGSASGGRAGAQILRQMIGGREVLSDLQNAVRLPVGTTTGVLGNVVPGTSIVGAVSGDLARTLTGQDAQFMQASMASLSRELSILMSPVYGGNYAAQQIEPLVPKQGDTLSTVIFKLARLSQSADNALEAASTSPILSNDERAYAIDLRKQIQAAIPWTPTQAMDFAYRGHPHETFGQFVQRQGITGPAAPAVGTVEGGYRFDGGDPSNPGSWTKVQ